MIRLVGPEVGVPWLLDEGTLTADTEMLTAIEDQQLGWFTVPDLRDGVAAGIGMVGDMPLRTCEVSAGEDENGPYVLIACGEYSVLFETDPPVARLPEREAIAGRITRHLEAAAELGGWSRLQTIRATTVPGPLAPTGPVRVTRGCRHEQCGWWVTLPPVPSPCPNTRLPRHEYV